MTSRTISPPHQLPRPTTAAVAVTVSGPDRYAGTMTKRPDERPVRPGAYSGLTKAEWDAARANMRPSTPDDCTITADGRRLDTKEKLLDYLAVENAKRAQAAKANDSDHS
jgi:hypothetical protein